MTVTTDDTPDTENTDAEQADTENTDAEPRIDDDEPGTNAEETDTAPRPRRWLRRLLKAALAAAVVAVLGASGYLGWTVWQDRRLAAAGEQAEAAAVAYAQVLTSIDSDKVDENFNQVLDGATGEFKDMYSQSSMQLRQLLIDNKASARGVVIESAVQSATEDRVVVLLFVDQSVSNTNVPDPRLDRSRIKMTMDRVEGRWKASKVELP